MLGAHIASDPDKLLDGANIIKQNGGNIIQLFVEPMSLSENYEYYKNFAKFIKQNNMKCVVHISYTINCSKNWNKYSLWIEQFIMEIKIASLLGAFAVVVHLGKQLKLSLSESLNNMYTSLLHVHNSTKQYDVLILLETSTGQGTELCYKLDELTHFYRKLSKHKNTSISQRFGLCVDTCHIFVAGYDIRSENAINTYLDNFNELIGLKHIKLVHLNDSKNDINSNLDRHANIGDGFIGESGLTKIAKIFNNLHIPMILETPKDNIIKDLKLILKNI